MNTPVIQACEGRFNLFTCQKIFAVVTLTGHVIDPPANVEKLAYVSFFAGDEGARFLISAVSEKNRESDVHFRSQSLCSFGHVVGMTFTKPRVALGTALFGPTADISR